MRLGPSRVGLEEGEFRKVYELAHSATLLHLNTLRTGDADLRLYITTVQDG